MLGFIKKYPLYLFLLPVFFVLHGFVENWGFIDPYEALLLLGSYLGMALVITLFSYIFFKSWTKASLVTTFWMSFFFFFGAIHEFLKTTPALAFLSRYSILLGTTLVLLILLFIFLKRTSKPFNKFSVYLNALFLIYILTDTGIGIYKSITQKDEGLSVYTFTQENKQKPCDTCAKPNIYFLLFDEYAGSTSLKEEYNFDNDLDSFLIQQEFKIQRHSNSNYNFTPFSMSSILNMSYIDGIKNINRISAEDYSNTTLLIRDNEVIKYLDMQGYEIINYSVFDLAGNPSMVEQSFLPLKTKLISDRTLFAQMNKDIGWLLMTKIPFKWFDKNYYFRHRDNNIEFHEKITALSESHPKKPFFVYGHFYMPHSPYFYNKKGELKSQELVMTEYKSNPAPAYLEYLIYTNTKIKSLLASIRKNDPKAVVILMSDHGYRNRELQNKKAFFRNLNAVYFPDHQTSMFYDSITGVNQFRLVFNKMFNANYPLLKDSSYFLVDKKGDGN